MEVSEVKKKRIGEVADMFGISGQTIRNWLKNDDLKGLFSPGATPPPGRQAEFTDEDVQLINSIWSITSTGNHDWRSIAENLKSGWRESFLPDRAAIVGVDSNSAVQLMVKLATSEEALANERRVTRMLEERIEELKMSALEHEEDKKKLIEAQTELRMWREGWRPPSNAAAGSKHDANPT